MGYNVRVVFLYYNFPRYYYPLLHLLRNRLASSGGIAVLDKYLPKEHTYTMDGIKVTRIPVKKTRPGGAFIQDEQKNKTERIILLLESEGFVPDAILGHFLRPCADVISQLKTVYNVPTAVSLHGKERTVDPSILRCKNGIDLWGYRSEPIGRCFEALYGQQNHFYCFSGVSAEYISATSKQFKNGVHKFIYVGNLIKRKHPTCIVPAVAKACNRQEFCITYVGEGSERRSITNVVSKLKIQDRVIFTGRLKRDEVTKELYKADVFVMLSTDETFGLVYLEAMARGCIVIASKDEGMDGIINHGVNGFLCEAGDSDELATIITSLNNMTSNQLEEISKQALTTAANMTDKKMAEAYIKTIEQYGKEG